MESEMVKITDFLTVEEIERCRGWWMECLAAETAFDFVDMVESEIIAPNIERINKALGQENYPRYLAYGVEYIFSRASQDG